MYLTAAGAAGRRAAHPAGAAALRWSQHPDAMLLELLAVRLDPEKAKDAALTVDLVFPTARSASAFG